MLEDQDLLPEKIIFVIGVSGSGKSTIGRLLAKKLDLPFIEGDEFHSEDNVKKMSSGTPLTDDDRWPWLDKLNQLARDNAEKGCIIACSALKNEYRVQLAQFIESKVLWIYLHGSLEQIRVRLVNRADHFMRSDLLKSQFDTLEKPSDAIHVDISDTPLNIIQKIVPNLNVE